MRNLLKALLLVALFAAAGLFYLGKLYRDTENGNFARSRAAWEKSQKELDCVELPVHCAIRDRKFESLNAVVAKGFSKDSRDTWGNTALFYAWKWTPPEDVSRVVAVLLDAGADPNIGDGNGDFPLWLAIRGKKYDLAEQLIKHGADPDIRIGAGAKKMTLLSETVARKDVQSAEFLIKHGAGVAVKDGFGYDACGRANLYGTEALFTFCASRAAPR